MNDIPIVTAFVVIGDGVGMVTQRTRICRSERSHEALTAGAQFYDDHG